MRGPVKRKIVSNYIVSFHLASQDNLFDLLSQKQVKKGSSLCQGSRSESQLVFIQGMPLVLPFNVDIFSRNGRVSEDVHLSDDITIKANGSFTTYKLFGVAYGNCNHFKSAMFPFSPLVPQAG